MKHEPDGWWFQNPHDESEWLGPYDTKAEAAEERASFKRNWVGLMRPGQVCTGEK